MAGRDGSRGTHRSACHQGQGTVFRSFWSEPPGSRCGAEQQRRESGPDQTVVRERLPLAPIRQPAGRRGSVMSTVKTAPFPGPSANPLGSDTRSPDRTASAEGTTWQSANLLYEVQADPPASMSNADSDPGQTLKRVAKATPLSQTTSKMLPKRLSLTQPAQCPKPTVRCGSTLPRGCLLLGTRRPSTRGIERHGRSGHRLARAAGVYGVAPPGSSSGAKKAPKCSHIGLMHIAQPTSALSNSGNMTGDSRE